ncbi:hypothetical protein FSARC_11537 [Fusarium sarcochroum]|uniref:Cytochrome P450 monooxygenase n=1 Tax=Fusarium sarcochroum TaxID=1208366 RepID=A0A8H4TEM0_9HYPO|nr:hypothetical protein FSARC_11537 [Fusarium sarcochroum]
MLYHILELGEQAPKRTALTLFFVFLGVLYFLRRALLPKPILGIPYNKRAAESIFGDIPEFRAASNRREWWAQQAVRHQSPLVQVFVRPFGRPWVLVADYFEASDISMRRLKEFDRSEVSKQQFGGSAPGHSLTLRSSDPQYKKNKELTRDLMSISFLQQASAPQMYAKFTTLLKLWDHKRNIAGGRPFDASEDVHDAVLDIIARASFGIESDKGPLNQQLDQLKSKTTSGGKDDAFEFEHAPLDPGLACFPVLIAGTSVAIKSPAPVTHHFLYRNLSPSMRRARADLDNLTNRETAKSIERRRLGRPQRCALDNMLAREEAIAEKEGRKPEYHSQIIKSELVGYLVAGHDSTSSALKWGMKYLIDDQRVQTRLCQEIQKAHSEAAQQRRAPTVDEIIKTQVPYLDAVIEETLRYALVAPVTLRQAMTDTEILGVHVPKGTTIGLMGNGPSVMLPSIPIDPSKRSEAANAHIKKMGPYDESDIRQFIPERWLRTQTTETGEEETVFDSNRRPSQSMGLGPRMCFGKKLAYMEVRMFFTLLFWEFRLGPIKPELAGHEELVVMTRTPKNVYVNLKKAQTYG